MMSQVKNLRAMFEQRGDSSPPERGREGAPGLSESPRPLSRVRTNFVTVEKDGRVGLQRDTSADSIPTLSRTMSAGTDGDLPTPTTSQAGATEVNSKSENAQPFFVAHTPKMVPLGETTSVSPAKLAAPLVAISKLALGATSETSERAPPFAAAPADVKRFEPTLVITSKENHANQKQKENAESKPTSSDAALAEKSPARKVSPKPLAKPVETGKATSDAPKKSPDAATHGAARLRATNGASKDKSDAPKAASTTTTTTSTRSKVSNATVTSKETVKTASKATTTAKNLPKAISTAKTTTKTSTKSTGVKVKTPTSPSKRPTSRLAAPKSAADKKTVTSTVAEKKSTSASATPKGAAGKKPSNTQTHPPNSLGSTKPKAKSPTRPVHLPSSLTTHTASSATKTHQSPSRQSGNLLAVHGASQASATRSLSRASGSTVSGATSSTTKTGALRRQKSTIGLQRPSIGPPPKQPARDHPIIKKEKPIDESFLERMMRPTQSFASKTADKVHHSPPRSIKSRDSYGSSWSATSSTKPTKEKVVAAPKKPVIVEPVQEVDVTTLPTGEPDTTIAVGEVKEEAEEEASASLSGSAEPTGLSDAEPEEAIDEIAAVDEVTEEAVSDDEVALVTETTVEETVSDITDAVEAPTTAIEL